MSTSKEKPETNNQDFDALLKNLVEFEEERTKIIEEYAEKRKELYRKDGKRLKRGYTQLDVDRLNKQEQASLKWLDISQAKRSAGQLTEIFNEAAMKSTRNINKISEEMRQLMDYLSSTKHEDIEPKFGFTKEDLLVLKDSPEKLKEMEDGIKDLVDAARDSNPYRVLLATFKDLFSQNGNGEVKRTTESIKKIGEAASSCGELVGGLAGKLGNMFAAMGNNKAASALGNVQGIVNAAVNIGQGFAKGGVVGGIAALAGEAINGITKIIEAKEEIKPVDAELQENEQGGQDAVEKATRAEKLKFKDEETIFGDFDYAKALKSVEVMNEAYSKLREEIEGTAEEKKRFENSGSDKDDLKAKYAGLASIKIAVGAEGEGLTGSNTSYQSILESYKDIVDEQGNLNVLKAKSILQEHELDAASKEKLKKIIELKEEAENAGNHMHSYLSSIFGSLGDGLSDALVDAFRNGTDASAKFSEVVGKMLEDFAQEMVFSTLFSPIFQEAQEKIEKSDSMSFSNNTEKMDYIMGIVADTMDKVLDKESGFYKQLNSIKNLGAGRGLDLFSSDKKYPDYREENQRYLDNRRKNLQNAEKEYESKLSQKIDDGNKAIEQAKINRSDEGIERDLRQAHFNYEQRRKEIKEDEKEYIKDRAESQVRKMELENPYLFTKKNKNGKLEDNPEARQKKIEELINQFSRDDLSEDLKKVLDSRDNQNEEQYVRDQEVAMDKLLQGIRSYEQQRQQIAEEYAAKRQQLYEKDGKTLRKGVTEDNVQQLNKQEQADLKAVNDTEIAELQKDSNIIQKLFEDAADKSTQEIDEIIQQTEELMAYLKGTSDEEIVPSFGFTAEQLKLLKDSPEKLKEMQDAIKKLKAAARENNPFRALVDGFKDLLSKGGDSTKSTEAKIKAVGAAAATCAQKVGGFAGQLREMFEAMGNDGMASAMKGIQGVMSAVESVAQGFANGGIAGGISAIASQAIKGITGIFKAQAELKKAQDELHAKRQAQHRAYMAALREEQLANKESETIFGNFEYAKAINSVKVMKDAYSELRKEMQGTAEQQWSIKASRYGLFGWGKDTDPTGIKALNAGLASIEVVTGYRKTGLFGWGHKKAVHGSILDEYPELIDKQGKLNRKLAETIINNREFKDSGKEALEQMIDLYDAAEKGAEQAKGYLTEIFGSLGNSLTDALVDAFRNGSDAAEKFGDTVEQMLEKMGQQMIYEMTFKRVFNDAQARMEKALDENLSNEQRFGKFSSIISEMMSDISDRKDDFDRLMKQYQDIAATSGLKLWQPDKQEERDRTATTRGIATASQDSVDELNGRMTAIQGHTFAINESTRMIMTTTQSILQQVTGIHDDTRRLEGIEKDIHSLRTTIESGQAKVKVN